MVQNLPDLQSEQWASELVYIYIQLKVITDDYRAFHQDTSFLISFLSSFVRSSKGCPLSAAIAKPKWQWTSDLKTLLAHVCVCNKHQESWDIWSRDAKKASKLRTFRIIGTKSERTLHRWITLFCHTGSHQEFVVKSQGPCLCQSCCYSYQKRPHSHTEPLDKLPKTKDLIFLHGHISEGGQKVLSRPPWTATTTCSGRTATTCTASTRSTTSRSTTSCRPCRWRVRLWRWGRCRLWLRLPFLLLVLQEVRWFCQKCARDHLLVLEPLVNIFLHKLLVWPWCANRNNASSSKESAIDRQPTADSTCYQHIGREDVKQLHCQQLMGFVWERDHLVFLDHVIHDHLTFLPKVLMGWMRN